MEKQGFLARMQKSSAAVNAALFQATAMFMGDVAAHIKKNFGKGYHKGQVRARSFKWKAKDARKIKKQLDMQQYETRYTHVLSGMRKNNQRRFPFSETKH